MEKEIGSLKEKLKDFDERLKTLEDSQDENAKTLKKFGGVLQDLQETQQLKYKSLEDSHLDIKKSQSELSKENMEQTKILNRIEERTQNQTEAALKNEQKANENMKWLLQAVWALVAVIVIAVIGGTVNAFWPH